MEVLPNGNILMCGSCRAPEHQFDIPLISLLNPDGNVLWENTLTMHGRFSGITKGNNNTLLVYGIGHENYTDSLMYLRYDKVALTEADSLVISHAKIEAESTYCADDSLKLTALPEGLNYVWNTGQTTQTIFVREGSYTVEVKDNYGHQSLSEPFVVTERPLPQFHLDIDKPNVCPGDSSLVSIIVDNDNGGPCTFEWPDTPSQGTGPTAYIKSDATFHVGVTDQTGCSAGVTSNIEIEQAVIEPVCLVTVEEESGKNMIVWEKMQNSHIAEYRVYKEGNRAGEFEMMGSRSIGDPSYFIDTDSNPEARSLRYSLSTVNNCGTESELSEAHKTMHLTINAGMNNSWNLIWEKYEGFDYASFNIYRGSEPLQMQLIATMPSNIFTFSDQVPPLGTSLYQIEAVKDSPCELTELKSTSGSFISSLSNLVSSESLGETSVVSGRNIRIWPNPSDGVIFIRTEGTDHSVISVISPDGKVLQTIETISGDNLVDLSHQTKGIYFIRISNSDGMVYRKIVLN